MKSVEWWRGTAQHLWRSYFASNSNESIRHNLSPVSQNNFRICDTVFRTQFSPPDQDILRMYYTTRWGDDIYAVEDYSVKHNIPVKVIWIVIRRANRSVMEELGILDRKEKP